MAQQSGASRLGVPTLAEDLLLLLFQPESGSQGTRIIAGRDTLHYILAGAVLAELELGQHVRTLPGWGGSTRIEAVAERPPSDDILRSAWDHLAVRPRGVQAMLAAVGPTLRGRLLDRLVERGDIRRSTREARGSADMVVLEDGGTGRRAGLLSAVRDVLVDGVEPQPRVAALAALLSGSGTLPQSDHEIPWTAPVMVRAMQLQRGNRGAEAVAEAVARSATLTIVSNVVVAAAVLRRQQESE